MSASFVLELDTGGPQLNVVGPYYTVPYAHTEFVIEASETLGTWQDIYVIDSGGNKHPLIMTIAGKTCTGSYNFADCTLGIATLYIRLEDDVHNLSETAQFTINILLGGIVSIIAREDVRLLELSEDQRMIGLSEDTRSVEVLCDERLIKLTAQTRQIVES